MSGATKAFFHMDGWAGRTKQPCEIVGETPKRYRVRLTERCRLPGRNRWGVAGQIVLMPKYSVTRATLSQQSGKG